MGIARFQECAVNNGLTFRPMRQPGKNHAVVFAIVKNPRPRHIAADRVTPCTFFSPLTFRTIARYHAINLHAHIPRVLTFGNGTFPLLMNGLAITLLTMGFVRRPLPTNSVLVSTFAIGVRAVVDQEVSGSVGGRPMHLVIHFLRTNGKEAKGRGE